MKPLILVISLVMTAATANMANASFATLFTIDKCQLGTRLESMKDWTELALSVGLTQAQKDKKRCDTGLYLSAYAKYFPKSEVAKEFSYRAPEILFNADHFGASVEAAYIVEENVLPIDTWVTTNKVKGELVFRYMVLSSSYGTEVPRQFIDYWINKIGIQDWKKDNHKRDSAAHQFILENAVVYLEMFPDSEYSEQISEIRNTSGDNLIKYYMEVADYLEGEHRKSGPLFEKKWKKKRRKLGAYGGALQYYIDALSTFPTHPKYSKKIVDRMIHVAAKYIAIEDKANQHCVEIERQQVYMVDKFLEENPDYAAKSAQLQSLMPWLGTSCGTRKLNFKATL